jgi:hypothetical protein
MSALWLAQETGKVLRWLKAPGDRIARGGPIVEIETDKVTWCLPATFPSVIRAKLPLAEKRRGQGCKLRTRALQQKNKHGHLRL